MEEHMAEVDYNIDETEQQEIMDILTRYWTKETGSAEKAQMMLQKLASLLSQDGANLIHIGNTVFLMIVTGKGEVEIHTMTADEDSVSLANSFRELAKTLKGLGVKKAYTYANDPRFEVVAKRTRLPIKKQKQKSRDGKDVTVYTLEIK
jgi:predicted amino acid-binding ACT domain protein